MEITVHIFMTGERFNPSQFDKSLPDTLKGDVLDYRKIKNRKEKYYWNSKKILVRDKHPMDVLYDLILKYEMYLRVLPADVGAEIYGYVWGTVNSLNDLRGFFIDKRLIQLCNDLDLEIDIGLAQKIT